jgi:hypothetical protein
VSERADELTGPDLEKGVGISSTRRSTSGLDVLADGKHSLDVLLVLADSSVCRFLAPAEQRCDDPSRAKRYARSMISSLKSDVGAPDQQVGQRLRHLRLDPVDQVRSSIWKTVHQRRRKARIFALKPSDLFVAMRAWKLDRVGGSALAFMAQ